MSLAYVGLTEGLLQERLNPVESLEQAQVLRSSSHLGSCLFESLPWAVELSSGARYRLRIDRLIPDAPSLVKRQRGHHLYVSISAANYKLFRPCTIGAEEQARIWSHTKH